MNLPEDKVNLITGANTEDEQPPTIAQLMAPQTSRERYLHMLLFGAESTIVLGSVAVIIATSSVAGMVVATVGALFAAFAATVHGAVAFVLPSSRNLVGIEAAQDLGILPSRSGPDS